jgi:Beta-galactosidase
VRRRVVASLVGVLALLLPGAAAGQAPPGFFGVVPQAPLGPADFERMRGLGVTVRVIFDWGEIEPKPGRFDFTAPDALVGEATAAGVRVLPCLVGRPAWLGASGSDAPLSSTAAREGWARFLATTVARYGPGGDFWQDGLRRRPLRFWQIWNEPNFKLYWGARPSPRAYAELLRISAPPIRSADPGARIVAAGLAPIEGTHWPWEYLRRLYLVPGVERYFDVAALHPYASTVAGVEIEVRRTRRAMARAGDGRTRLLLSELGVASATRRPSPSDRGLAGQARFLERLFSRLLAERRQWRLAGAYWFTWRDAEADDANCVFCEFAGLFDAEGRAKPAWHAFRRSVAGTGSVR